jgi:hypothetical protein
VKRGEIEGMGRERDVQAKIEDSLFLHALGLARYSRRSVLTTVDKTAAKLTGKYSCSTNSQEPERKRRQGGVVSGEVAACESGGRRG